MSEKDALELNSAGVTISDTLLGSPTAIAGTRTSATRFTRSSGVWYDAVVIDISSVVASGGYDTFYPGETVTETGSSSTGVVVEATATRLVMKTITGTFTGSATLTGGTSGVTATGGTPTHKITNLKGWVVWAYVNGGGAGTGTFSRVTANTATYVDVDINNLHASCDRIVLFKDEAAARDALDISYGN
jgi:hypothetical protein